MVDNTLPVRFERNYAGEPFVGTRFLDTASLNAWLTNPTRYAGQQAALVEGGVVTLYKLNATADAWLEIGGGGNPLWTPSTAYEEGTVLIDGATFKMYRVNASYTSDATDIANDITGGFLDLLSPVGVPGGTDKSIVFLDSSGNLAEDPAGFTYDVATQRMSLGTNNTVNGRLNIAGAGSVTSTVNIDTYSNNAVSNSVFRMRRAQGSEAAPSRVQSNVDLGDFSISAYNGSNFINAGGMVAKSVEDWAATRGSLKLEFYISPVGNSFNQLTMSLLDDYSALFEGAIRSKSQLVTLNEGDTQANGEGSGFVVDFSDATNAGIVYDSTLDSKFKVGEVGSELEVGTIVKDTEVNLTTFAATASNGQACFATDTKVSYVVVDGALVNSGAGGALAAPIDVLGVTQGSYEDGDNIPAGTDFEVIFNNMLRVVIPPTYFPPTLSLAGSGPLNVEAGTLITPTLTPTFTQNDAGPSNNYELFKETLSIFVNGTPVPHIDTPFTIGDENIDYDCTVDYDEGPTKNDNTGTPDPTGKILAGSISSNTVIYRGQRKAFYDVDGDIVNIRSNTRDTLNPQNGTVFNLTNETGGDVVIAYPDTLRDLTQASLTSSGFTFDILSEFVREADQLVNDASGANPINYKVFRYNPASNFTNADFQITI